MHVKDRVEDAARWVRERGQLDALPYGDETSTHPGTGRLLRARRLTRGAK